MSSEKGIYPETGLENPGFDNKEEEGKEEKSIDTKNQFSPTFVPSSDAKEVSENVEAGNDEEERENWANPLEFLLSCISMSVGLGNVWRFPYTAYTNGGGAFLIPYIIVLFLIGKPVYFLELSLGQFSSLSQVQVWNVAPIFKGVGYTAMMGTLCIVTYYCSVIGTTIFYFIQSFRNPLPWADCRDDWDIVKNDPTRTCSEDNQYFLCMNSNQTFDRCIDLSVPQHYFSEIVIKEVHQIKDGLGTPDLALTGCLFVAWAFVCLAIIKVVKSSGKVAYFTAIFPYIVLFILLIRGATLTGAWNGIKYFIEPEWKKLLEADVWYAAVSQCFFSLSTGFGPIIMFASFNKFKHNVYRDAMIISIADMCTSILAGVCIFSILGNLAHELNVDVQVVAAAGPGLAFVSYADAIAKFSPTPVPQIFAVLFFLMLFSLGLGSATSLAGGIITIICDQYTHLKRPVVTVVICVACFLIGLMFVTPGGQFMITMVDDHGANFVIYVVVAVEVMAVSWVYGLHNFCRDVEFMMGIKISLYWKFCWGILIPIGLPGILIYALATWKRYPAETWPDIAVAFGWVLSCLCLSLIPICAVHSVWTRKAPTLKEKFFESLKPNRRWGPRLEKNRKAWLDLKNSMEPETYGPRFFTDLFKRK